MPTDSDRAHPAARAPLPSASSSPNPIETPGDRRQVKREFNSYSAQRRDQLIAEGVCINGRSHGRATDGVLCRRCRLVHRYGRILGYEAFQAEQAEIAQATAPETASVNAVQDREPISS